MPDAPIKFSIINLGCKVNKVESDACYLGLQQAHCIPSVASDADIIIVNTCAVTSEAEAKTRKAVRKALKQAPKAQVFVTGCAAVLDQDTYRSFGSRVQVVPQRPKALQAALDYVQSTRLASMECSDDALWSTGLRRGQHFPARMPLKVQDGCNNACTYCIVHVARGKSISRPLESCLREAQQAFDAGVKELVLTGVDLGFYRHDQADLIVLLQKLLEIMPQENSPRIRLSSIEPLEFDDRLAELMAQSQGKICAHLHLPLQSGCSKTLAEMGRPYKAEDFAHLVDKAKEYMPQLSLTTDVIVGFPGETDQDFQESYEFCKAMGFSKMHVFRYSRRAGTPAAARLDQVDPHVSAQRSQLLRQLSVQMAREDAARRIDALEGVLVEAQTAQGFLGTSESYHRVVIPQENLSIGDLCLVRLSALDVSPTIIEEDESSILLKGVPWKTPR